MHIVRIKRQITNNVDQFLEALLRFLCAAIPIPVAELKRGLVGVWVKCKVIRCAERIDSVGVAAGTELIFYSVATSSGSWVGGG